MTKSFRRKVLLLFFSIASGALSGGADEIRFKPDAKVAGPLVKLSDVAVVQCADQTQTKTIGEISLFPVPTADRPRLVRTIDVRQLLRLHDVEIEKFDFSGPAVIRVSYQKPIELPELAPSQTDLQASETVQLLVARHALAAGQKIEANDLELATVPSKSSPMNALKSLDQAVGRELTRAVAAGQPMDGRFLKRAIIVQKGQAISIVARGAGVQARTTAKALENGSQGDSILVESVESKEKYTAVITGRQQAEVIVKSRIASEPPAANGSAAELARRRNETHVKESK